GMSAKPPGSFALDTSKELLLKPGETRIIAVPVSRTNLAGQIYLTFNDAPAGIHFEDAAVPEGTDSAEIKVTVAAEHPAGRYQVTLHAESGDVQKDAALVVHIPFLPTGFEVALPPDHKQTGDEVDTDINNRKFYKR